MSLYMLKHVVVLLLILFVILCNQVRLAKYHSFIMYIFIVLDVMKLLGVIFILWCWKIHLHNKTLWT